MNVTFQILEDLNLVYVRHSGTPSIPDAMQSFAAYRADPRALPGQKHLVDLTGLTGLALDPTEVMRFMAQMAEQFCNDGPQTMLACLAPSAPARKLADMGRRSWEGLGHLVYRIFEDEAEALAFLGLPGDCLAQRLNRAS